MVRRQWRGTVAPSLVHFGPRSGWERPSDRKDHPDTTHQRYPDRQRRKTTDMRDLTLFNILIIVIDETLCFAPFAAARRTRGPLESGSYPEPFKMKRSEAAYGCVIFGPDSPGAPHSSRRVQRPGCSRRSMCLHRLVHSRDPRTVGAAGSSGWSSRERSDVDRRRMVPTVTPCEQLRFSLPFQRLRVPRRRRRVGRTLPGHRACPGPRRGNDNAGDRGIGAAIDPAHKTPSRAVEMPSALT
jgi:hypothetical protein